MRVDAKKLVGNAQGFEAMSRTIVAAKLDEGSSRALANRSRPIFVEEKVVVEDGFVEMGFADFVQVRCHVGVGR